MTLNTDEIKIYKISNGFILTAVNKRGAIHQSIDTHFKTFKELQDFLETIEWVE